MIHVPFSSRVEAGRLLAKELSARGIPSGSIVLALTRGGVPVGFAVADRLHLPLDIVVARKLGVPWQPELAMGAIAGEARVLDIPMIRELEIADADIEDAIAREQAEMQRREARFRAGAPALDVRGKTAILVDDGLATGSTMLAALRHVRGLGPARIVVAIPVGSHQACERIGREADDMVCLATPHRFFAVGEWYTDFQQVSDAEVQLLLTESRRQMEKHAPAQSAT